MNKKLPEYWLRGPLPEIHPLLQPAAHALLQAQMEIHELMEHFPAELLWQQPAKTASPAFHLQHITGVLDRLFTYASGGQLSQEQLSYLSEEGRKKEDIIVISLLSAFDNQIKSSIEYLQKVTPETLTEERLVGRNKIPSTRLGLLFHAAEHTMRHLGQLLVSVKVIVAENNDKIIEQ